MHQQHPEEPDKTLPPENLDALWTACAEHLLKELGQVTFDLWFSEFKIAEIRDAEIDLMAPGAMYAIWVEENFKETLLSILQKHYAPIRAIRFLIAPESPQEEKKNEKEPASASGRARSKWQGKSKVIAKSVSPEKLLERGRRAGLVETLTFENFVPGDNSELAWAAAHAVASDPGKTYQPLFYHSGCGLGKTHLLHGIGWALLSERPSAKIIFATAEQFANDYIDSIQRNALVAFRKRYREADLLLLDDVQFLGRKEGLQREFFHTFNQLVDRRCQIVLASDCPASEINELEDRLSSRFQWGLSVEIHRPGLETRAAILRRKRDDWGMSVSDEHIDEIVEHVRGNVRVLEGALIRIAMVSTMNDGPIERSEIRGILEDLCHGEGARQLDLDEIKRAVSEHYGIELAVINGKVRTARVAEARQVAMYLIRTMTELSLVDIASSFGKDHGTVIHAVKKIRGKCETSASLKSTVELIKRRLTRGGADADNGRGGGQRPGGGWSGDPDIKRTLQSGPLDGPAFRIED